MTDQTAPVESGAVAENASNDVTPTTSQETHSDGLLGVKETATETKVESGLDPELYDTQTSEFRKDVALKKIESFKDKEANYQKQVKDLRRIVSKGKAPEDATEYDAYEPDSLYARHYEEPSEQLTEGLTKINEFSKKFGLNTELNKNLKDMFNEMSLDGKSQEQLEQERVDWKTDQLKVLGDDASTVIGGVKDLLNSNMFSESEKNALLQSADKDANVIAALHKFKRLIRGQDQVPFRGAEISGVPSAMALAREYNNASTAPERRREILATNRKAYGKPLPMLRN